MAYTNSVFLNVPFDRSYKRLFEAAIFAIYECGFIARCAKEDEDSSTTRVEKIYELIQGSKYGIHDISRVTLDTKSAASIQYAAGIRNLVGRKTIWK